MKSFVKKMTVLDIIHPLYFLQKDRNKNIYLYLMFMGLFIKISTNHKPNFKYIIQYIQDTLFVNKEVF